MEHEHYPVRGYILRVQSVRTAVENRCYIFRIRGYVFTLLQAYVILAITAYFFISYSLYGTLDLVSVYIALLVVSKVICTLKDITGYFLVITALVRYPLYVFKNYLTYSSRPKYDLQGMTLTTKEQQKENEYLRGKYITYTLNILNAIFLVHMGRVVQALIWLIANFALSLVLRPFLSNPLLFGLDADSTKFSFLSELRKTRHKKQAFGLRVN